ncbi:MAG: MBL fold metallo-hydrolase [Nocardioides sp.]
MRITKFGHACVRVEYDGQVAVVDPGGWTQPEATDGADVVLVTHEHADHFDVGNLRRADAPVFTIDAVAAHVRTDAPDLAERLTVVAPGEQLAPGGEPGAGVAVRVVGELHAVIHPEYQRFHNSGYLISAGGTTLYHPGDSLIVPGVPVDVLCVPVSAPWLKLSDAMDFAREVGAPRNLAIHDRVFSADGLRMADAHLTRFLTPTGQEYLRVEDGADLPPG